MKRAIVIPSEVEGSVKKNSVKRLLQPLFSFCERCLFDKTPKFLYTPIMSPTIFRVGNYRFYFFSREEERIHVHIVSPDGEAKFWVEPIVALVAHTGFSKRQLGRLHKIIEEHKSEIVKAWQKHFEA